PVLCAASDLLHIRARVSARSCDRPRRSAFALRRGARHDRNRPPPARNADLPPGWRQPRGDLAQHDPRPVRPLPAGTALHARPRAEVAREARHAVRVRSGQQIKTSSFESPLADASGLLTTTMLSVARRSPTWRNTLPPSRSALRRTSNAP